MSLTDMDWICEQHDSYMELLETKSTKYDEVKVIIDKVMAKQNYGSFETADAFWEIAALFGVEPEEWEESE